MIELVLDMIEMMEIESWGDNNCFISNWLIKLVCCLVRANIIMNSHGFSQYHYTGI